MRYCWIFSLVFILSCNSEKPLDVQGHSGARGLHPENSIPAFKKALDLKVHTLELAVVISNDNMVVVSYEPYMSQEIALDAFGKEISEVNEKSFNLYRMTYDSIKLYDCGSKGHSSFPYQIKERTYKPLLAEVIDLAETKSKQTINYNIEIRSRTEYDGIYLPPINDYVALVLDIIRSKGIQNRTSLQSLNLDVLEAIKKQNSDLKIALKIDSDEVIRTKLSKLSFTPEILSPHFKILDQQTVLKFQEEGFKIIPWTVNEVGDINLMIDLNVDGIISDYPNRVIQLINLKK